LKTKKKRDRSDGRDSFGQKAACFVRMTNEQQKKLEPQKNFFFLLFSTPRSRHFCLEMRPVLPDFSWDNLPKCGK
jgi:hypothetical protein